MKRTGEVFMDKAEELGVRTLLEAFASYYARNMDEGVSFKKRMCVCKDMLAMAITDRQFNWPWAHDMTCPCHRFVVFCGTEQDKEAMRAEALAYASMCVLIDAMPDGYLYADVVHARRIIHNEKEGS